VNGTLAERLELFLFREETPPRLPFPGFTPAEGAFLFLLLVTWPLIFDHVSFPRTKWPRFLSGAARAPFPLSTVGDPNFFFFLQMSLVLEIEVVRRLFVF